MIPEPVIQERIDIAREHAFMLAAAKGEYTAMREMRKHLAWYLKGSRGAARLRELVNSISKLEDIESLLAMCEQMVADK